MNIIISGCNRGIGQGIASVLIESGHTVFGLNRTVSGISMENFHEIQCDIGSFHQVEGAINIIKTVYRKDIDVVIANAGIRRFGKIDELRVEDWEKSVQVNLNGVFHLMKLTLPMLRQTEGNFVVVGSHAEKYPFDEGGAYCSTKGALKQLVDCCIEGDRYQGVRATYLSIGSVKNRDHGGDESWKLRPTDLGLVIKGIVELPKNILIPYMDVRPAKPLKDPRNGIERLQYV